MLAKTSQLANLSKLLAVTALAAFCIASGAIAQDILRYQSQQQQDQASQNEKLTNLNQQLANLQLPPQLAQLSPQQLHQLAQIRELQIQQQQQRQAQAAPSATALEAVADGNEPVAPPPPIGAEPGATSAPETRADAVINRQPTNSPANNDGAYNEAGSELEGVDQSNSGGGVGGVASAASINSEASGQAPSQSFEVNWNKCPQLDPSESEKAKKTQVITKCLQSAPIPQNLTRENVENHREQIATCALKVEGWFDDAGNYRYEKAETEIRAKKLEPSIETHVLKFHVACKEEAGKKFPRSQEKLIDQVQFYQACMDYYISIVCEIEVSVDQ